jgi:uncharacterized membrane protein YdjX (TVP38/TMEM64 family)
MISNLFQVLEFSRNLALPCMQLVKSYRYAILALIMAATIGAVILFKFPNALQSILHLKDFILHHCRRNPVVLFAALVILPGFAFPVSALLILAGVVWGSTWQSCAWGVLAMSLNMTWAYWFAAGPARGLVTRCLGKRWDRWKQIDQSNLIRLTILLRVTPGVPLFAQNYILGLFAVPYLKYILISIPLNAIYVVGFILTGGAVFKGNFGLAITGILILAAASLLIHFIRIRLQNTNSSQA